jgi:hypothetical protein
MEGCIDLVSSRLFKGARPNTNKLYKIILIGIDNSRNPIPSLTKLSNKKYNPKMRDEAKIISVVTNSNIRDI